MTKTVYESKAQVAKDEKKVLCIGKTTVFTISPIHFSLSELVVSLQNRKLSFSSEKGKSLALFTETQQQGRAL